MTAASLWTGIVMLTSGHARTRALRAGARLRRMAIDGANRCGQRNRIFGRHQERFPRRDDVRDSTDTGGDDRNASRHRLEEHDGRAFRAGTQNENIERRKSRSHVGHQAMPMNVPLDAQPLNAGAQRLPLATVAHHGDAEWQVGEMDQGLEEHVGSLLAAQATDPADPKSLGTHSEDVPCRGAIERGCALLPAVLYNVNPVSRDAIKDQLIPQWTRDGDDGLKGPVGASLNPFVQPVFPIASQQPANRGDRGNAQSPSRTRDPTNRPRSDDMQDAHSAFTPIKFRAAGGPRWPMLRRRNGFGGDAAYRGTSVTKQTPEERGNSISRRRIRRPFTCTKCASRPRLRAFATQTTAPAALSRQRGPIPA